MPPASLPCRLAACPHCAQEWGFDGLVMSDWGGTYSTVPAALCGLDLEMPGQAGMGWTA